MARCEFLVSKTWIPDSNHRQDSGFLSLNSGIWKFPGIQIPQAKISRILESWLTYKGQYCSYINHVFSLSIFYSAQDSRAMDAIRAGMEEWTTLTCIRFKRRTDEKDYVYFKPGSGKLRGIALVKPTWGSSGGGKDDLVDKPLYRHLIPNSSVIVWRLQSLASQLQ